jgi:hypothetical protein
MQPITLNNMGAYFSQHCEANGHTIVFKDGQWYASNAAAVTALAATYDPRAVALTNKITEVKVEAKRRINLLFPEWKQTNMIAAGVELQDLWRQNGSWTPEEQELANQLNVAWATIKAIRVKSDQIEAQIAAMTNHEDIERFDVTSDQLWS